jgi:N-carbamoylputrescine amidase
VTTPRKNPVVGLVQSSTGHDKKANVEKAVRGIREAASKGATLVCLQELFAGPYFCQVEDAGLFDLAESIPGPTTEMVAAAARDSAVTVIASVFEKRAPGVYHNSIVIYGPDGRELSRYRKMHIPDDPQYYEKFYFTPGDLGFVACRTPDAVVGPLICWDQWYPEAARLTALRGAELLCYPTAIGWLPRDKAEFGAAQLGAWQTIQRSHAIANGVFVVAVNRVGVERSGSDEIEFWGRSFVCDPGGVVIAEAGSDEQVLVVECDLAKIEATRRGWPFLRDRRIDAFGDLTKRWLGTGESG